MFRTIENILFCEMEKNFIIHVHGVLPSDLSILPDVPWCISVLNQMDLIIPNITAPLLWDTKIPLINAWKFVLLQNRIISQLEERFQKQAGASLQEVKKSKWSLWMCSWPKLLPFAQELNVGTPKKGRNLGHTLQTPFRLLSFTFMFLKAKVTLLFYFTA